MVGTPAGCIRATVGLPTLRTARIALDLPLTTAITDIERKMISRADSNHTWAALSEFALSGPLVNMERRDAKAAGHRYRRLERACYEGIVSGMGRRIRDHDQPILPRAGRTTCPRGYSHNEWGEIIGQSVIVEERRLAPAGMKWRRSAVAKAPPDGYTFLLGTVGTPSAEPRRLYKKGPPTISTSDFASVGLFLEAAAGIGGAKGLSGEFNEGIRLPMRK